MSEERYNFRTTEGKWQKAWEEAEVFKAKDDPSKPKYYALEMFPYPSGKIHMGHVRNYAQGDVIARFKLAQGYNVLHPMGWDSFGLPAENAAIKHGVHPAKWTRENIANMREEMKKMGLSIDWSREVSTCEVEYYRHEQKMFLDFFKKGLAYRKDSWVNWDPVDQTVLANEQVVDGKGWRTGAPVEKRKLSQWFLKITAYADELLENLKTMDGWPEKVRTMQENWIGKSYGAYMYFPVIGTDKTLTVFTTRADTLFGASFCAISAGHPIAQELAKTNPELTKFIKECEALGTSVATIEAAEKKGFNTGLKVMHPFPEEFKKLGGNPELPLYVANFVLMEYGTGAIFACPAHDQRDLDFARKYGLPVRVVVAHKNEGTPVVEDKAFDDIADGVAVNSAFLDGLATKDAIPAMIKKLEEIGKGKATVQYRLRDWGISRQRYWGCPIPVIHCEHCGIVPVPEKRPGANSASASSTTAKCRTLRFFSIVLAESRGGRTRRSAAFRRWTYYTINDFAVRDLAACMPKFFCGIIRGMHFLSSLLVAAELALPLAEVKEVADVRSSVYPGRVTPIALVDVVPQVSGEIHNK